MISYNEDDGTSSGNQSLSINPLLEGHTKSDVVWIFLVNNNHIKMSLT